MIVEMLWTPTVLEPQRFCTLLGFQTYTRVDSCPEYAWTMRSSLCYSGCAWITISCVYYSLSSLQQGLCPCFLRLHTQCFCMAWFAMTCFFVSHLSDCFHLHTPLHVRTTYTMLQKEPAAVFLNRAIRFTRPQDKIVTFEERERYVSKGLERVHKVKL